MPITNPSIVESAIKWAISIAEDDSHGYSQIHRWGNPDYDCSSLMISAYQQAGVPVKDQGASYTGNMKSAFMSLGFMDVTATIDQNSGSGLLPGDVLLNTVHHTAMYIGEYKGKANQIVHASIDEVGGIRGPSGGDQTGLEICIRSYYRYSKGGWDVILRYPDSAVVQTTNTIVLNADTMTPYIAIFGSEYQKVNYDKLRKSKVAGVMFWAGGVYSDTRIKRTSFINPNLGKMVSDCTKANMPYALYWDARSRTHIEADAECKSLYYIVAKYPPKLGLWIHLDSTMSKLINDDILNLYYRKITEWGLKDKCGLYITPTQLNRITWSRFEDKYYLWLIDHNIDIKTIDNQILQPELFEVPD